MERAAPERAAWLAEACGEDAALRAEVESLLAHDASSHEILERLVREAAHEVVHHGPGLQAGQTLLHYRLTGKIGEGGMGTVWRATDTTLDRDVAIKVLPPVFARDEQRLARFEREAKMLASLNHPNVAAVYSVHERDGVRFLTMEYVPGDDLATRLAGGALPLDAVLSIARQIAVALEEAHAKGIVHRDLKAGNVKLTPDGRIKVLDFGLAKAIDDVDDVALTDPRAASDRPDLSGGIDVTQPGVILGTAAYMPPEQARGLAVDTRADIWAFGVLLFEMLAGVRPFTGATLTDVLAAVVSAEPDWRALPPGTPPELERLIRRCLAKDVRQRLPDISDARVELEHLLEDRADTASVPTPVSLRRRASQRRAARRIGFGLLVMLLALGLGVWTSRRGGETTTTSQSIAVLPFLDLSPERDQEYFADGLTEELLNVLARNPRLRVAGRTSTFQFKDTRDDPRAIGRRLSVSSVLEGSVRRSGDRVRISVQLVSTADGFHLWAETYDREMHDIIAVQEEIARSVADALKVTLLGERGAFVAPDANVPGYTAYLQGKYFLRVNTKESLEKAVRYFGEAVTLDPTSAPAWSGLSIAHVTSATEGHEPPAIAYAAARAAVERALAIDPNLAQAHVALSTIRRVYDWDWAGADAAAQQALRLAPNSGDVVLNAARAASAVGRLDEAFHLTQRAAALDPLNVAVFYRQGRYAYFLGRLDDATTALNRALELIPGYRGAPSTLALVAVARSQPDTGLGWLEQETQDLWRLQALAILQHVAGRPAEADAALAQLVAGYADVAACQIAEVYAYRGDVDRAFEWLERAYRQRDGGLSQLKGNPHLVRLESDPRYADFLRKMRLPPTSRSSPRSP